MYILFQNFRNTLLVNNVSEYELVLIIYIYVCIYTYILITACHYVMLLCYLLQGDMSD